MEQLATISIIVAGKVQGVFFRQNTKEMALGWGVKGYVKNLQDGKVFIEATGTKEQLAKLTAWCRQGPRRAEVSGLEVKELPLQSFDDFSIERR